MDPTEKALFAFTGGSVLAEELGGGARHHENGIPYRLGQTDKNSPEKSGFDFLGKFVLAERAVRK
ncbi:MAG: hypothetical protein ACQEWW_15040 [Bacillota bacterium]